LLLDKFIITDFYNSSMSMVLSSY